MNQHYLAAPKREALAQRTGLSFKQITSWFEYRRARNKKIRIREQYNFPLVVVNQNRFRFSGLD
ncbi:hypothetical protein Mgra_00010106, partial [Meloidogyne graminicola]